MYEVYEETFGDQYHIVLVEGDKRALVCASADKNFHVNWIERLKNNHHSDIWWSENHNKGFLREMATTRSYKPERFDHYGTVETVDDALNLIETMVLFDDEARARWER